jgi:hypothetical protein
MCLEGYSVVTLEFGNFEKREIIKWGIWKSDYSDFPGIFLALGKFAERLVLDFMESGILLSESSYTVFGKKFAN